MMIKNTGFEHSAVSGNYPVRRQDKAEARRKADSSSFSDLLSQTKLDRIELSKRPAEHPSALGEAKKKILGEISQDTDARRMDSLRESVSSGRYVVNAPELAQIMLAVNR